MKTATSNIALGIISLFLLLQLGGCAAAVPYVATGATAYAVEVAKDPQIMGKIGDGISNFIDEVAGAFSSGPTEARAEPRVAWRNPDKQKTTLPRILPGKKKVRLAPPPILEEPLENDTAHAGQDDPAKKERINPLSI